MAVEIAIIKPRRSARRALASSYHHGYDFGRAFRALNGRLLASPWFELFE
jgi:hypothetical protein